MDRAEVKTAVIPYIHQFSHRLKQIAGKAGVRPVFSVPNKLGQLCCKVKVAKKRKVESTSFVACKAAVVYKITLSCGRCYVDQTGPCINGINKHKNELQAGTGDNVASHCASCSNMPPLFRPVHHTENLQRKTRARDLRGVVHTQDWLRMCQHPADHTAPERTCLPR